MKFISYPLYLFFLLLFTLCSCGSTQVTHLTEPLHFAPVRISISHTGGQSAGGGDRVVSEAVSYSADPSLAGDGSDLAPHALDTNHVYAIPAVVVRSKARFASLRQGSVGVDFAIHIPRFFLSDAYHICLHPELVAGDSVVALGDVVLRGHEFIAKQERDYARYHEYVSSIISPEGYDTAFVDRGSVEKVLAHRRERELSEYYDRWSLHREYLAWRDSEQQKYDRYNIHRQEKLQAKLARHDESYRRSRSRLVAMRADTSSLHASWKKGREELISSGGVYKQITLGAVPAKYRDFYLSGVEAGDISPDLPGEHDSLLLASRHLLHKQIAFNELKDSRRQDAFRRLVPTPYRDDAHYESVIAPEWNFNYAYKHTYPVSPGLKRLSLTLKGTITATDGSYYHFTTGDTLTYVISSMDELADATLVSDPGLSYDERLEYAEGLRLLGNRQYRESLAILNRYKDYNTALALTCLGYNREAFDLLSQLEENAHTCYLSAILCCRLSREQDAIRSLEKACLLDDSKIYRADRDPEISRLVKRYGLTLDSL